MAELNVTRDDDLTPDAALAAGAAPRITETDHLLPETTHAAAPGTIAQVDDPELARMQIEQTRARMSDTIGQIEETLLRKKEQVEERLDVMAPVRRKARENPYPIIGGVFLAGLILGFLTGGDDDDDEPTPAVRRYAVDFDRERAHGHHWEERARTWERRARRLMDVANRQEAELLAAREGRPRRRLFRRGRRDESYDDSYAGDEAGLNMQSGGYGASRGEYDGMPLHDADSYPPHDDEGGYGYGREPLPAPI
ncbi:MAG TPA: hypothetical protein VEQ60_04495 [Longimicrobium sp.]|nr:hypothetical protein [Longimicrobium sp.]